MANRNSAVIYAGPSKLDGSPIVVILSGLTRAPRNEKTGNMLQTWILRADMDPQAAIGAGLDASICGNCIHRGWLDTAVGKWRDRSCYVDVGKAPQAVYRSFAAGRIAARTIAELAPKLAGRRVRFGAYGDPAAVPVHVWEQLATVCSGHTGYTHQWRQAHAAPLSRLVMASADSVADRTAATAAGWRTFRVRLATDALQPGEITCPASDEAGKRTTCADCRLCNGTAPGDRRKSIAIINHGIGKNGFIKLQTRAQLEAAMA